MSKMDDLRAMREAHYEQLKARTAQPVKRTKAPQAPTGPVQPIPRPVDPAPVEAETSGERPCGHRAISGRSCTREHGHAAKSHRYA